MNSIIRLSDYLLTTKDKPIFQFLFKENKESFELNENPSQKEKLAVFTPRYFTRWLLINSMIKERKINSV